MQIAFSAHGRIRQIGMYFPRYLISSILTACFAVVIEYLGKYLTICLIISIAKEAIYKRQNSIFICSINTFQRKWFTKIGIDSGFACEWLVGVIIVVANNTVALNHLFEYNKYQNSIFLLELLAKKMCSNSFVSQYSNILYSLCISNRPFFIFEHACINSSIFRRY